MTINKQDSKACTKHKHKYVGHPMLIKTLYNFDNFVLESHLHC